MKTTLFEYTKEECEEWNVPYFDLTDEERRYFLHWGYLIRNLETKANECCKPACDFWHIDRDEFKNALKWYFDDPGKKTDPEMSVRALLLLISQDLKGRVVYLDIEGKRFTESGRAFYISKDDPHCPEELKGKAFGACTTAITKGCYWKIYEEMRYRKVLWSNFIRTKGLDEII